MTMRIAAYLALLVVGFSPASALARSKPAAVPPAIDIQHSGYADLFDLEAEAHGVQNKGADTVGSSEATIAAWTRLMTAADARILPNGKGHPLGGVARVKIAVTRNSLGKTAEALELVRAGKAILLPHRDHFPTELAEGTALEGFILAQQGRAEEAVAALEQGLRDYRAWFEARAAADRTRANVTLKSNLEFSLSQSYSRLGRNNEALDLQRQSLDTRRAGLGPNDPDTVSAIYNLAQLLLRVGQTSEAETQARLAVALAIDHVAIDHPSHARAFEMLGIVLSRSGRPIEATDYLVRSIEIKRQSYGTDNLFFGYAVHNLAGILQNRERLTEAEPLFIEADQIFRKFQGETSPFAAGSIAYAGQISYAEGRFDEAVTRLRQAQKQLGTNKHDEQIVLRLLPDLTRALHQTGDTSAAHAAAAEYRAAVLATDGQPAVNMLLADLLVPTDADHSATAHKLVAAIHSESLAMREGSMPQDRRAALEVAMDAALEKGDSQLMASAMMAASHGALGQATRLRLSRLATSNPSEAAAMRAAQDAARHLDAAEKNYLVAQAKADPALADKRAQRDAAEAALKARRADWQALDPRWPSAAADLPDIGAIRSGLSKGEVFVALVPVYAHVYVLAIDGRDTRMARLSITRAAIYRQARGLRAAMESSDFDAGAAHQLYRALFPDTVAPIIRRARHVRLFAGGELAAFPFAALVTRAPGATGPTAPRWMIEDHAITMVSDFSALAARPRPVPARRNSDARLLAIADPAGFGQSGPKPKDVVRGDTGIARYFGAGGVNRDELARLPALPNSRIEAETMARLFGTTKSTLLLGDAATEEKLRKSGLDRFSVILFATHGLVAGEMENLAEPALVLSPAAAGTVAGDDGLLTLSEIGELRLSADWIILSACNSAAGGGRGLPAYSGLAEAFRYAGADKLLVTHWPVRDDSAAALTSTMLTEYQRGANAPQALRRAMTRMIGEQRRKGQIDPYGWAPFVLLQ